MIFNQCWQSDRLCDKYTTFRNNALNVELQFKQIVCRNSMIIYRSAYSGIASNFVIVVTR